MTSGQTDALSVSSSECVFVCVFVFPAVLRGYRLLGNDLAGGQWHIPAQNDLLCVLQCLCYRDANQDYCW